MIALNFSADRRHEASIALTGCGAPSALKSYVYTGGEQGFVAAEATLNGSAVKAKLPPYSISVFELSTQ